MESDRRLFRRRRNLMAVGCAVAALVGLLAWKASIGQRILDWAIVGGHLTVARIVLAVGLNPNGHPQAMYAPPLVDASAACRPDFVKLLLQRGAQPAAGQSLGYSPLRVYCGVLCSRRGDCEPSRCGGR